MGQGGWNGNKPESSAFGILKSLCLPERVSRRSGPRQASPYPAARPVILVLWAVSRISCLSSHAVSFSCSAGLKLRFRSAFSEGCYWDTVFTARVLLTASAEGQAGRGKRSRNRKPLSVARAYLCLFITIDTTLRALLKALPAPHPSS